MYLYILFNEGKTHLVNKIYSTMWPSVINATYKEKKYVHMTHL